jgi:hypothetical protein
VRFQPASGPGEVTCIEVDRRRQPLEAQALLVDDFARLGRGSLGHEWTDMRPGPLWIAAMPRQHPERRADFPSQDAMLHGRQGVQNVESFRPLAVQHHCPHQGQPRRHPRLQCATRAVERRFGLGCQVAPDSGFRGPVGQGHVP